MMKFKIFEKLDPDYVEIESEEYYSFLLDKSLYSEFTPREISEIRKFSASKGISLYHVPGTEYVFPKRQVPKFYFYVKYKEFVTITAHKLEDGWFTVTCYGSIYHKKSYGPEKYFKCDQMEGLMVCLREILKNIPDQDPNILISKEDQKSSLEVLRNKVFKKIRIMSFEELSKLDDTLT
jgi:hypothetical protein